MNFSKNIKENLDYIKNINNNSSDLNIYLKPLYTVVHTILNYCVLQQFIP